MSDFALPIVLGIALAAATGFRVFLPMLIVSAAAYTGHLSLDNSFAWLGTPSALTMLSVAAFAEILAYYIPELTVAAVLMALRCRRVGAVPQHQQQTSHSFRHSGRRYITIPPSAFARAGLNPWAYVPARSESGRPSVGYRCVRAPGRASRAARAARPAASIAPAR
jgi:Domain of unknown function (DUF4126)